MKNNDNKYTNSVFYEVFLTGKYIKKMGEQLFKKLGLTLTSEEFSTLDFLYENENVCQRDLAVLMLINRANMGKILNNLEKMKYIERKLSTKCNHPVKLVMLSDAGRKMYLETLDKLKNTCKPAAVELTEEESSAILSGLQKMRNILKNIVEIDI